MKSFLVTLSLISINAHAATLVDLSANRSSYMVGQIAILKATVAYPPTDDSSELYFEARLNGEPIKIVKTSDTTAQSLTPTFSTAGSDDFEVDVYLQNKYVAQGLQEGIDFYSLKEIPRLQNCLLTETDPAKIAEINAEVATDTDRLNAAREALVKNRSLLEVDHLSFNVNPSNI
jgi:hypothetical protein